MKTPLQVGSTKLENNNRLHIMSNNQEQLINNIEKCDQVIKLQMEEELNYYKVKLLIIIKIILLVYCVNLCMLYKTFLVKK